MKNCKIIFYNIWQNCIFYFNVSPKNRQFCIKNMLKKCAGQNMDFHSTKPKENMWNKQSNFYAKIKNYFF